MSIGGSQIKGIDESKRFSKSSFYSFINASKFKKNQSFIMANNQQLNRKEFIKKRSNTKKIPHADHSEIRKTK